jgi:MinD-like ATPase involved in chromosome partitioning or flagellar assembly
VGLPAVAAIPADEDVRAAERAGIAVLDHAPDGAAVAALERLAGRLATATVPA